LADPAALVVDAGEIVLERGEEIEILVRDQKTKDPGTAARVRVIPAEETPGAPRIIDDRETDQDGRVHVSGIDRETIGETAVVISRAGFVETRMGLDKLLATKARSAAGVEVLLARAGELRGRVVDASGTPISGAQLSLVSMEPRSYDVAYSASSGEFRFPAVASGRSFELSARADGYVHQTLAVDPLESGEMR